MTLFDRVQTLQSICFFVLVDRIHTFSPDAIYAQLPPALRSMLLVRLPAVDVIKLEGTSVVRGIDMNAVWEKLCNQMLTLITLCPFEFGKHFHFEGSWKEHYFAVFTSLLLNLYEAEHIHARCARDHLLTLLFGFRNFCTFAEPDLSHPIYLYKCFIAKRFEGLYYKYDSDALVTPSGVACYVMDECRYRPKVVYISCRMFYYSPFWTERDSPEVSSTLREFLRDTQQLVLSNEEEAVEVSFDDEGDDLDIFHKASMYLMEVILSSTNPKLETLTTTNTCSAWVASRIIHTVCELLCEVDISVSNTSISNENLLKNIPYKHLKRITLSMDTSHTQMLVPKVPKRLESAIKTQTSVEDVQLSGWPCEDYLSDSNSWYSKDFSDLFSVLASLFKQPQFWNLELVDTSLLPHSLQEVLLTFFTVRSPNHHTLKLGSVHILPFAKCTDSDAFHAVDSNSNETLLNKSLYLSKLELSHKQETLIFSYPLLKLELLTLVSIISKSQTKSLQKAGELLCTNETSYLKTLILKDLVILHPNPQNVVSSLVQSPNLQYLEIENCDIGPGGLLTGLSCQIPNCGSLKVLKLVRVNLGRQSEDDFRKLFSGIFSLPHVSIFSLDVSSNGLTLYHVAVIMNIWKQTCPGKKLEELIVSGNVLEPDLLPLPNIAQHVVYKSPLCK